MNKFRSNKDKFKNFIKHCFERSNWRHADHHRTKSTNKLSAVFIPQTLKTDVTVPPLSLGSSR